ncbi:MAG: hypothetical protein ACH34X_04240 [Thiolinea sp.]
MYLSNSRLLSLLLALAVLTLCLLWLLTKQSTSSLASSELNTAAAQQLAAKQPDEDETANAENNTPTSEPVQEPAAQAANAEKPQYTKVEAKSAEVPAIPEGLVLSEKELKALSSKERKRYEDMLTNLRSLHEQSAKLSSERQQLEQQKQELERRNQELAQKLEDARQKTEAVATAPDQAKP